MRVRVRVRVRVGIGLGLELGLGLGLDSYTRTALRPSQHVLGREAVQPHVHWLGVGFRVRVRVRVRVRGRGRSRVRVRGKGRGRVRRVRTLQREGGGLDVVVGRRVERADGVRVVEEELPIARGRG